MGEKNLLQALMLVHIIEIYQNERNMEILTPDQVILTSLDRMQFPGVGKSHWLGLG